MRVAGLVLLLVTVLGCSSLAGTPKVTIDAKDMALDMVVSKLSDQAGVQIILDTGVLGSFSGELSDMDLEKVLGLVTAANNLKWQKLYAKPDEKGKIPMPDIKAQIDALSILKDTPLVVFDPATGKKTVFARIEQKTADSAVDPEKLGMKEFYFIFKLKDPVKADEKPEESAAAKFGQLRQQQMDLFMQMSPEEQKAAVEQEFTSIMNMPAEDQVNMMRSFFGAARNMDPQLRDQFRRTMMEAIRSSHGQ
ncbi:MAG: DUF4974 domain-containing protein [Armatimonadota bacterium]